MEQDGSWIHLVWYPQKTTGCQRKGRQSQAENLNVRSAGWAVLSKENSELVLLREYLDFP